MCATGFVANAQAPGGGPGGGPSGGPGGGPSGEPSNSSSLLPGSEEVNGHWNMSSKWSSGSISGTLGVRYSTMMNGPYTTIDSDDYNWDVLSGFTDDIELTTTYNQNGDKADRYTMKPNYNGTMLKSSNSATGTAAKAKVVATREFTFTWVPRVAGSKPTKDLNVFVGGTATAGAGTQETDGVSVKAWIGAQPEDQGEEAHSSLLDNVRGGKLFRVSKEQTSGTVSLSLGAQASAPGDQSPLPRQTDNAESLLSVSAKVDDRSVTISSSNIDPSYRRTMDASHPTSKYRNQTPPQEFHAPMIAEVAAGLLNEPKGDGSMTGDTVATYRNGQWRGVAGFIANTPGNWNDPTYEWSVSGESTTAYGYTAPEGQPNSSMMLGLNLGTSSQGFPKSSVVTATVTDGHNGAVGENTYDVTWHFPYEKTQDLPDGRQKKEVLWISDDPVTPLGGGIEATTIPAKPFDAMAAIDDVRVIVSFFGLSTGPISELQEIFQTITDISKWGDSGEQIDVTANQIMHTSDAFEGALSEYPENIQGMTTATRDNLTTTENYSSWKKYTCYGGYVRLHHKKNYLADRYDSHGFDSSNHLFHYDVTEQYRFENFYQKQVTTPVPPTLGDREVPPSYNVS